MKRIHHTATHVYYDGIQVFEARDSIGGHYIGVAVEATVKRDRYLLKGVSPEALGQFLIGGIDLRALVLQSPEEDWYLATFADDPTEPLLLEHRSSPLSETDYLPGPGLFLSDDPSGDEIVETARKENALVVEIRADSPRAAIEHRVAADTLAGILSGFQALVRQSHRMVTRGLGSARRPPDSDLLDVLVPAASGSFRVVLASAHPPDVFGSSFLIPAFRHLDTVFEQVDDPERTVAHLRENRGRFAGATLNLMRFLNEQGAGLRYGWADQDSEEAKRRGVSRSAAARIVEASATVPEIEAETVEWTGQFQKFNRHTGFWGLLTEKGSVQGRLREGGPNLDGLEVGGRYRFVCEERIETISVSGKDTPTRTLVSHEPAHD